MAIRKPSWRERRWNIFIKRYKTDLNFKKALDEFFQNNNRAEFIEKIDKFLVEQGIDSILSFAIIEYLENPNLDDEEYMKSILPITFYWNSTEKEVGPGLNMTPVEYLRLCLSLSEAKVLDKLTDEDLQEINESLAGGGIVMQFDRFMKKTELKEFIDEYWYDIKEYLNPLPVPFDQQLKGAVKEISPIALKRDNRIMELYAEGFNSDRIASTVVEEGLSVGDITSDYVRKIISRRKKMLGQNVTRKNN